MNHHRDPTSMQYSAVVTVAQMAGRSPSPSRTCHSWDARVGIPAVVPAAVFGSRPCSRPAYARTTRCAWNGGGGLERKVVHVSRRVVHASKDLFVSVRSGARRRLRKGQKQ